MTNFLDQLTGGNIIDTAFQTLIAGATGGFKGRPQWRDLEFMNDAQNRLWPDEIKRQGQFLEGLAPSQANAYNTYQDTTYASDTARQTDRIKSMSSSLGMSPWEITGSPGSSPLPSPGGAGQQQGTSRMPEFLQGIIPLKIAQMSNQTQLQTAKLQANTQRYIADQSTGKGALPLKQIEQMASTIKLQDIQHSNGVKDLDIKNQAMVVQILQALISIMPKDTLSVPGLTSTTTPGWQTLAKRLLSENQQFPGDKSRLDQTLQNLPPDDWGTLKRTLLELAEKAAKTTEAGVEAVGGFLGSLTKP